MRTKALVAAAALLAAGALSSMAQSNVYSLNVVGYYNIPLTNGYNMIANQLDLDGTGLNNTVTTALGTTLPTLTRVYAFVPPASFPFVTMVGGVWTGTAPNLAAVNAAMQPGGGVFVQIPASATYPQTVTIVGNVLQGTLVNGSINHSGYAMVSSKVPQAGTVQTQLGLTPAVLDFVYQYLGTAGSQSYGPKHTYTGTWSAGEPSVGVGEAFYLSGHAATAWSRNFTVQ